MLASDAIVRRLNCAHRGKDAATNVLSFPFQRPPGAFEEARVYLGDVVLAAETVRGEAAERGIEAVCRDFDLSLHAAATAADQGQGLHDAQEQARPAMNARPTITERLRGWSPGRR